jgi:hypothetical protein
MFSFYFSWQLPRTHVECVETFYMGAIVNRLVCKRVVAVAHRLSCTNLTAEGSLAAN